jgi:hypothetical protein
MRQKSTRDKNEAIAETLLFASKQLCVQRNGKVFRA